MVPAPQPPEAPPSVLSQIATIIAPLFLIAGTGFWWGRTGRPFDTDMVGQLVTNIGVPCLIFATLTELTISSAAFGAMAGAFAAVLAGNTVLALIALKATGKPVATFFGTLVFPNNGNMGLPLCLFAFGEQGVAFGICAFVIMSVVNFTVGPALASGQFNMRAVLRNLQVYAVLVSLAFMLTHTPPPEWLTNTTRTMGGVSIPLMLFALGVSLSKLRVSSLRTGIGLAVLRLAGGFAVGYGVALLFGFTGVERGVLVLQSAMPAAVINYLFAVRYGAAPGEVAGVIVMSTLLSFLTLPLLLWSVL